MTSRTCSKCTPGSACRRACWGLAVAVGGVLLPCAARADEPRPEGAEVVGFTYVDREGRAHVIAPGADRGEVELRGGMGAGDVEVREAGRGAPALASAAAFIGPPAPARGDELCRVLFGDAASEVPYLAVAEEAAGYYSLPVELVLAVIRVESAFDARAVSAAGAMGLMQLMPETAAEMLVADPFEPRENVFGGARYLRILVNRFDGDVRLALAAYNAGPGAVERWGGVPAYLETARYVVNVMGYYHRLLEGLAGAEVGR